MFKNSYGFSDAQLLRYVPAALALHAHDSRSKQFGHVCTIDIVHGLREMGFEVTGAWQARTQDASKKGYTKHALELTHRNDLAKYQRRQVGDLFLQFLITNSHAGDVSFLLDRQVYRLACSNGLTVPETALNSIRLQHRKTLVTDVVENVLELAANSGEVMERIAAMRRVHLSLAERLEYGQAALALRYPRVVEAGAGSGAIPTPEQIMEPTRRADAGDDVFTAFNVAEDKLIKGGVWYQDDQGMWHKTRAIKSMEGMTDLNKGLWTLAEARL